MKGDGIKAGARFCRKTRFQKPKGFYLLWDCQYEILRKVSGKG
jgi:hypothetical protein